MKSISCSLLMFVFSHQCLARIGETFDQCVKRYGEPVKILKEDRSVAFRKGNMAIIAAMDKDKKCWAIFYQKCTDDGVPGEELDDTEITSLKSANAGSASWKANTAIEFRSRSWKCDEKKLYASWHIFDRVLAITTEEWRKSFAEKDAQEKRERLKGF